MGIRGALCIFLLGLTLVRAQSLLALPGESIVGSGYNLLSDNPTYPMQLGSKTVGQIFDDFTYLQNQTWTVDGQVYAIPDQLHVARAQSFGVKTFTYQSVTDYLNQQASDFGLGLEYEFDVNVWKDLTAKIPVGASALMTHLNQQMTQSGSVLLLATENIPLYGMQQFPGRNLSSAFIQRVQQLQSDPDYASFLAQYGTHYQSSVEMGGQASLFDVVSGSQTQYSTSMTIQASVRLSFFSRSGQLSPWIGTNKDTSPPYTCQLQRYIYGGDTSLGEYTAWVKSVPSSPAAVSRKLSSLLPLIHRVSPSAASGYMNYLQKVFASLELTGAVSANNLPYLPYSQEWANSGAQGAVITGISYFNDDDDHCQWCMWNVGSSDGHPDVTTYHYPSVISWDLLRTFGSPPTSLSQDQFPAPATLRTHSLVQESNQCDGKHPCIPGLETMGLGFDIITGSSALPVFQWTFYQGNTWTSPYTGETYSYPDQIILGTGAASETASYVYDSYSSYCSQSTDASSSGWHGYFFQLGRESQSVRRAFDATQSVLGMSEESYVSHTLTLQPTGLLASHVLNQSLSALPSEYEPAVYFQFLSTWGTHYSSYGSYGGKARLFTFIDQQIYMSSDSTGLQQQLTAQFGNWKAGVGWGSSQQDSTWGFSTESFQWVTFYGGDATLALTSQWSEWIDTTHYAPAQVNKDLVPIWTLATDSTIRTNIQTAVKDYYSRVNAKAMPPPIDLQMRLTYTSVGVVGDLISDHQQVCSFDHGFGWGDVETFPTSISWVNWYFTCASGYMCPTVEIQFVDEIVCGSTSGAIFCPPGTFAGGAMGTRPGACGSCSDGLEAAIDCMELTVSVGESSW